MQPSLPEHILASAQAFYSLPLPEFIEKVAEFTRDDKRLELLLYATRQCYLDAFEAKQEPPPSNILGLIRKRPE